MDREFRIPSEMKNSKKDETAEKARQAVRSMRRVSPRVGNTKKYPPHKAVVQFDTYEYKGYR